MQRVASIEDVRGYRRVAHARPQDSYNILSNEEHPEDRAPKSNKPEKVRVNSREDLDILSGQPKPRSPQNASPAAAAAAAAAAPTATAADAKESQPAASRRRSSRKQQDVDVDVFGNPKPKPVAVKKSASQTNVLGQEIPDERAVKRKGKKGSTERELYNDNAAAIDPITFQERQGHLDIRGISADVTEEELADALAQHGTVLHLDLLLSASGASRGLATVIMQTYSEARRVIEEMNGEDFRGSDLQIAFRKTKNSSN